MATENVSISNKKIKSILHDVEKTAKAINLVYVQDRQPGIQRIKKNNGFHYFFGKKKLSDKASLERINKLVIPPAWENVWICHLENGHLQATGIDSKQRKQYRYHSLWNNLRNQTKFYRLHAFGKALPLIRQQIKKDLALPGMPIEKVLAVVISLMEQTHIRIGNNLYEKLYGSFGLTTLKDRHVKISGDNMQFLFTGKKGVSHNITIKNKRLAKIVKQCRDIPGKELFQYYDDQGKHKRIDSGMVNNYVKSITSDDFTAKDFRTWAGSVHAITAFKNFSHSNNAVEIKRNIVAALDDVAKHLGNTRTVCKKYYVHPIILSLYESEKLHTYLRKMETAVVGEEYTYEEKLLMEILEQEKCI